VNKNHYSSPCSRCGGALTLGTTAAACKHQPASRRTTLHTAGQGVELRTSRKRNRVLISPSLCHSARSLLPTSPCFSRCAIPEPCSISVPRFFWTTTRQELRKLYVTRSQGMDATVMVLNPATMEVIERARSLEGSIEFVRVETQHDLTGTDGTQQEEFDNVTCT